jgi:hypothetical protein
MAKGGKRIGAGRPKGSKITRTIELADRIAAKGISPLEYVMTLMRDDSQHPALRFECAKAAMPYMHPRYGNVTQLNQTNVQMNNNQFDIGAVLKRIEEQRKEKALVPPYVPTHSNTIDAKSINLIASNADRT